MWVKTPFVLGLASLLATTARAAPASHQLHNGVAPQGASEDDFAHQPPGGGATYKRHRVLNRAEAQQDARLLFFNGRRDADNKAKHMARGIRHDAKDQEQEQPSKDDFAHQPPGGGATYKRRHEAKAKGEEQPSRDDFAHQPPGGGATYKRRHGAMDKGKEQPSQDDFAHQPPGGGATYKRGAEDVVPLINSVQSNLPTDYLHQAYVDKAAQEEEMKGRPGRPHPGTDNWSHMPPGGGATY